VNLFNILSRLRDLENLSHSVNVPLRGSFSAKNKNLSHSGVSLIESILYHRRVDYYLGYLRLKY